MTHEESVEGWEDSVLCGFVAMGRGLRGWLREPVAMLQCLALVAGIWAYLWVLTLACMLVGSL